MAASGCAAVGGPAGRRVKPGPKLKGRQRRHHVGQRPARQLKRTADRLVKRLGWKLAARVMTAPQYQLLKMTVRVGRLAVDAALEVQRGAER